MSDNSSSNKRIAKNSIFLTIRMVVVMLIALYTTRVVLHVLGVEDYGVNNVVCGFVTMFAFLNISMGNGIQRFFNYEYGKNGEEGATEVFVTSIYIQALLALLVVIVIEPVGLWYLHNKMVIPADRMVAAEWIFQLAVLKFVVGIMQSPFYAAMIAHERLDVYAIIQILDSVLNLGIVFLLQVLSGDKLILYGVLGLIITITGIVIYVVYCRKNFSEIRFRRGLNKDLFKKMLGFSGWNLFGSFSGVMENQGINLVLNFFYGPVVNAARGVANQINGAVHSFVLNITMPVRPQVTQSYAKGDICRTMSLTYGVSKMSSAVIMLLAIPACIEIDYLLHLWLGDAVPNHTAMFTILILMTSLVNNLNAAISNVVHATGVMRKYQLWGSIVRVCSVPMAYFLIKYYNIPELGLLAVLITATASHLACLIIVRKIISFSLREYNRLVVWPILLILILSVITIYPIHYYMQESLLRLILVCFTSVVVIVFAFYFIAFNRSERQLASQMLSPLLSRLKRLK